MNRVRSERSDAARHRDILLDAATCVFSREGPHVALRAVVEAAGLGRATLYRHFPDRTALLLALFDRDIKRLDAVGSEVPPEKAFIAMLRELGRAAREAPILADAWRALAPGQPEMLERQIAVVRRFDKPLADAIAGGEVRPGLTPADVSRLCRMITAANRYGPDADPADGERIIELVLGGISPRTAD